MEDFLTFAFLRFAALAEGNVRDMTEHDRTEDSKDSKDSSQLGAFCHFKIYDPDLFQPL